MLGFILGAVVVIGIVVAGVLVYLNNKKRIDKDVQSVTDTAKNVTQTATDTVKQVEDTTKTL